MCHGHDTMTWVSSYFREGEVSDTTDEDGYDLLQKQDSASSVRFSSAAEPHWRIHTGVPIYMRCARALGA